MAQDMTINMGLCKCNAYTLLSPIIEFILNILVSLNKEALIFKFPGNQSFGCAHASVRNSLCSLWFCWLTSVNLVILPSCLWPLTDQQQVCVSDGWAHLSSTVWPDSRYPCSWLNMSSISSPSCQQLVYWLMLLIRLSTEKELHMYFTDMMRVMRVFHLQCMKNS